MGTGIHHPRSHQVMQSRNPKVTNGSPTPVASMIGWSLITLERVVAVLPWEQEMMRRCVLLYPEPWPSFLSLPTCHGYYRGAPVGKGSEVYFPMRGFLGRWHSRAVRVCREARDGPGSETRDNQPPLALQALLSMLVSSRYQGGNSYRSIFFACRLSAEKAGAGIPNITYRSPVVPEALSS